MNGREGKPRRPVARQGSFRTIAFLTTAPIAALLLFLLWQFVTSVLPAGSAAPTGRPLLESRTVAPVPARKPDAVSRGDVVLILDDVGFDNQPLDRAMAIDPNVNFAILPNAPHALEAATSLNRRGFEILCHLPMEPLDGRHSPGARAITTVMTDAQIGAMTRENMRSVPFARGVNNHMGSRATRDERVMRSVLKALPAGVYFIDSRTTPGSVAERTARELNIPTAGRTIFLDDVAEPNAVRRQVQALARAAGDLGVAVGIGHMYPVTISVLREEVPRLRREGVRIRRASEAVQ